MSKIEWTEKTWNPIIGCSKVSEGCKNCYAEKMSYRLSTMNGKVGEDYKRIITDKRFNGKTILVGNKLYEPFKWKKPSMIFVNSMSDLFHDTIERITIATMFEVMRSTEQHIYQVLTKRPENALDFFKWWYKFDETAQVPANVWLGVTVESKKHLIRIKLLELCPATIRFVSFEPLLEDVGEVDLTGINWVIVGGESGHNRRPFNPDWARNILKQCREQGVKFFMKQIDKIQEIPEDLLVREYP